MFSSTTSILFEALHKTRPQDQGAAGVPGAGERFGKSLFDIESRSPRNAPGGKGAAGIRMLYNYNRSVYGHSFDVRSPRRPRFPLAVLRIVAPGFTQCVEKGRTALNRRGRLRAGAQAPGAPQGRRATTLWPRNRCQ